MINNSHQQKKKTGKKNDLEVSHGESKKTTEVFVSPWMCYIIQFNERLQKIDHPRTDCRRFCRAGSSEHSGSLRARLGELLLACIRCYWLRCLLKKNVVYVINCLVTEVRKCLFNIATKSKTVAKCRSCR